MRKGINPEKKDNTLELDSYHRIIIPIYIPNFEGYFKDSMKILSLCIESLMLTIHKKTRVTLYNNASHQKVKEFIDDLYDKHSQIDQVFHSKENMGKINAILAATKGNLEPLVTISDADVLFKKGWQYNVEKLFIDFPHAGTVAPVPLSKHYGYHTNSNWYYGFFNGKIRFRDVLNPIAMERFDKSLGNPKPIYKEIHLKKYLTISNKKNEAVMGCGHFVATLRREVFDKGSSEPAFIKIVGGVENKFIDTPNEKLGFLRLATKENFAYHLGNSYEKWMDKEMNSILDSTEENKSFPQNSFYNAKSFGNLQRRLGGFIKRILLSSKIKKKYFSILGLEDSYSY